MTNIQELKRMCKSCEDCNGCPFYSNCSGCIISLPDNADEIVEKWVKEHPKKTYREDFLKKFPNAPTDSSGCPNACLRDIYKGADYKCKDNSYLCMDCWNQAIKEVADERKHS
uniref:Uncharacterized protein n=1 Tax=Siphoviridae sp. ctqzz19 TaxID=2825682 RepID=A0A8S5U287_9CAUD|nr:MAG TPA: hypothetical protein [Siphoviridae sp. ctqzz19]